MKLVYLCILYVRTCIFVFEQVKNSRDLPNNTWIIIFNLYWIWCQISDNFLLCALCHSGNENGIMVSTAETMCWNEFWRRGQVKKQQQEFSFSISVLLQKNPKIMLCFWFLEKLCIMKLHCMSLINLVNSSKKTEYLESFGKTWW